MTTISTTTRRSTSRLLLVTSGLLFAGAAAAQAETSDGWCSADAGGMDVPPSACVIAGTDHPDSRSFGQHVWCVVDAGSYRLPDPVAGCS